jgi:2-polyprenyl-6-methoxyphenol hydroxylase-like FAD-dependent oxidoreductase
MSDKETNKRILISGGGIAGLTLGILLYEKRLGAACYRARPGIED